MNVALLVYAPNLATAGSTFNATVSTRLFVHPCLHFFIALLARSLTHTLTHSCIWSLARLLAHPLTHSLLQMSVDQVACTTFEHATLVMQQLNSSALKQVSVSHLAYTNLGMLLLSCNNLMAELDARGMSAKLQAPV